MAEANLQLVGWVLSRWRIPRAFEDDARQDGYVGLLKAIRGYDPDNGAAFSTYAVLCIRHAIIAGMELRDGRSAAKRAFNRSVGSLDERRAAVAWEPSHCDDGFGRAEAIVAARQIVAASPARYRRELGRIAGQVTLKESARIAGWTPENERVRRARALAAARAVAGVDCFDGRII